MDYQCCPHEITKLLITIPLRIYITPKHYSSSNYPTQLKQPIKPEDKSLTNHQHMMVLNFSCSQSKEACHGKNSNFYKSISSDPN